MKPIKPALLLGISTLLIVALGIFALFEFWNGDVKSEGPAEVSITSPQNESASGLQWREGTLQHYRVQVDSSFRMDMAGTGAPQALRLHLGGTLEAMLHGCLSPSARDGPRSSCVEITSPEHPGGHFG